MENFLLYVGLDVSKSTFHAAFRQAGQLMAQVCYENNAAGISDFIKAIDAYQVPSTQVLVALEHCGVYLEKILMALQSQSIFTWLWNPYIAKHAPLELHRHKDDPRDAQSMAKLAQLYQHHAKKYVPPSADQAELKALFRLRSQLIKQRTQLYNQQKANRDKAMPHPTSETIFQELIDLLSTKIKALDQKLKDLIFQSKQLKRIYQILISIPAIGPVTATQLILLTQGFTSFISEKAMAKYIGSMPLTYQSGSSIKRKPKTSKKHINPLRST